MLVSLITLFKESHEFICIIKEGRLDITLLEHFHTSLLILKDIFILFFYWFKRQKIYCKWIIFWNAYENREYSFSCRILSLIDLLYVVYNIETCDIDVRVKTQNHERSFPFPYHANLILVIFNTNVKFYCHCQKGRILPKINYYTNDSFDNDAIPDQDMIQFTIFHPPLNSIVVHQWKRNIFVHC